MQNKNRLKDGRINLFTPHRSLGLLPYWQIFPGAEIASGLPIELARTGGLRPLRTQAVANGIREMREFAFDLLHGSLP